MARRATSLGPKPSLFIFCSFPSSAFCRKARFFPLKRAFFVIFQCLPLFLLSLFLPHPFSLSLSMSLSLSLSLVLFFLPSFLSFYFAFFWFLVFVSFFLFLASWLCFMKRTTSKYSIRKLFFINPFSFFGFLSCFLIQSLSLILLFMLCFLFNMNVFKFQKRQVKTINGSRGVWQHNF